MSDTRKFGTLAVSVPREITVLFARFANEMKCRSASELLRRLLYPAALNAIREWSIPQVRESDVDDMENEVANLLAARLREMDATGSPAADYAGIGAPEMAKTAAVLEKSDAVSLPKKSKAKKAS